MSKLFLQPQWLVSNQTCPQVACKCRCVSSCSLSLLKVMALFLETSVCIQPFVNRLAHKSSCKGQAQESKNCLRHSKIELQIQPDYLQIQRNLKWIFQNFGWIFIWYYWTIPVINTIHFFIAHLQQSEFLKMPNDEVVNFTRLR